MNRLLLLSACFVGYVTWPIHAFAQDEEVAEAVAEATPAISSSTSDASTSGTSAVRPITLTVNLVDETTIMTGTLIDANTLSIKTAFGQAELPLTEVAGVRFPRGEDTATTVVMLNGDSITGATDLKYVNIETTWGSAKINGQSISSMLFVPGLAWQPVDVLGSRRWQLVEVQRNPSAPQPGQPNTPPASSVQVPAGQSIPSQPSIPGQPRLINPSSAGTVRINN